MSLDEAKRVIRDLAALSPYQQRDRRDELNQAVQVWLEQGRPNREEFARMLDRLILTPEMLWMTAEYVARELDGERAHGGPDGVAGR